ncbi:MAG: glycosyltransferase [Microscillaceae bacterium]|nr:glycosyltransferase [Microscillaceae bacterium]
MHYSLIVPVYNRPQELAELLESIARQELPSSSAFGFEVIVVEDGSSLSSAHVCQQYASIFTLHYFTKPNTGPGPSRNFGMERAKGDFFIFLDSDCLLPPDYLRQVHHLRAQYQLDAYGGPDAAHPSFTPWQKAVSYAMTAMLSTGGIRGRKKHLGPYQARSFNMGFSREVYAATGGFGEMRVSEDIDLSLRIQQAGFKLGLIPSALVYHKRRANAQQFFRQTRSFGQGRARLSRYHDKPWKWVHLLPSLFLLFHLLMLPLLLLAWEWALWQLVLLLLYASLVFSDALAYTRSLPAAGKSVAAVWIQLVGYGWGFIEGWTSQRKPPKND